MIAPTDGLPTDLLVFADEHARRELEAIVQLEPFIRKVYDPLRLSLSPDFWRLHAKSLDAHILLRFPHHPPTPAPRTNPEIAQNVHALRSEVRQILHRAQRHAWQGEIRGPQAWDPHQDAALVQALYQAGLISPLESDTPHPYAGRYRLHPDLPPPPAPVLDFSDAIMDETSDLPEPAHAPFRMIHDIATLAAIILGQPPSLTTQGTLTAKDRKRLTHALHVQETSSTQSLETHPRWALAFRGLYALEVAHPDPIAKQLTADLGVETVLHGETTDVLDRLLHRLIDHDLHPLITVIREALAQAGDGAIDEVVFLDLLREQVREIMFFPWNREGVATYPHPHRGRLVPFGDEAWEFIEAPLVRTTLQMLASIGILRRTQGVFAGTPDGRRWAGARTTPASPLWITGDLEIIAALDSLTPWERLQLEQVCVALQRDTVDRYRLDRERFRAWLSTHPFEALVHILTTRATATPASVLQTLRSWYADATRRVLWSGISERDVQKVSS